MPVTLRDISKSGGYNPPPGPLSRFPDLKNKIQAAMDFKKQSKAANAQEKYIFLHVFIIFGEPRKIQKRRKNARKIFVFCMFSMGSNGFRFVHWAHRTRLSGGLFFFSGPCHAPEKFQPRITPPRVTVTQRDRLLKKNLLLIELIISKKNNSNGMDEKCKFNVT